MSERRPDRHGAATSGRGTPAPVDLSTSAAARWTILLFLAGPVIWTGHFLFVYLVVEAGCTGGEGLAAFDPPVPSIVTVGATVVAVIACLVAAGLALRRWLALRGGAEGGAQGIEPPDRGGNLAFAGFLLSLLGAVTVLFVGIPALVLPSC